MKPDCYDIARQMLGLKGFDELPSKLFELLTTIDSLCTVAGGDLVSRQVVATVITFWKLTCS